MGMRLDAGPDLNFLTPFGRRGRLNPLPPFSNPTRDDAFGETQYYSYSTPSPRHEFNPSTQKSPAMSPRPSFSILHAQTPTFPHSCDRYREQRIGNHPHDLHKTREPAGLSFPTESNLQYDQKSSGGLPTLLGLSGCVKDSSTWNRSGGISIQTSNGGSH